MGIFDVFKTKVSEAAHKSGELAEDAGEKSKQVLGDVRAKMAEAADRPRRRPPGRGRGPEHGLRGRAGERRPARPRRAWATTAAPPGRGGKGRGDMVGSIRQNTASGVEKAGEFLDDKTGRKYSDQIQGGVRKAKDVLG